MEIKMESSLIYLRDDYLRPGFVREFRELFSEFPKQAEKQRWAVIVRLNEVLVSLNRFPTDEESSRQTSFVIGDMPIENLIEQLNEYLTILRVCPPIL
jgi:hypothetical protein